MPAVPSWHCRLSEIRAAVDRLDIPVLDRAVVERIFGLRRRQAIRLIAHLGGHQAGRTYLVEKAALASRLEALSAKKPVALERARKHRLEDALGRLARDSRPRHTAIQPPSVRTSQQSGWPEGIRATSGELHIAFRTLEDLLGRIFTLTETVAADPDAFTRKLEEVTTAGEA